MPPIPVFILVPAIIVAAALLSKSHVRLLPLIVIAALGTFVFRGALNWVVHPLAGLTLAFLASNIFSRSKRREGTPMLAAVAFLLVLSQLGAAWVVHPAAGLTLALLASVIFGRWRRELPTILAAVLLLGILSVLGAGWAVFPATGLALAWFATALFSGSLFRGEPREVAREASALPPSTGGAQVHFDEWRESVQIPEARETVKISAKQHKKHGKREERREEAPQVPAAPPDIAADIENVMAQGRGRLPAEVSVALTELCARVREAHGALSEHGLTEAESGLMLHSIAHDYVPSAVKAYLRLPASTANVTPLQDGKTGRDLLLGQLTLLLGAVRDLIADQARASGQEMLAHQRFLQAKFGAKKDFEL